MQQTSPQRAQQQEESLSRREQAEASKEVIDSEEAPKTSLPSTQNLGLDPFTFTYYGEEKNTPLAQREAEREGPTRTLDFRSETELWRFMTSIMPSEHQEMMHLQEGAWCQNNLSITQNDSFN